MIALSADAPTDRRLAVQVARPAQGFLSLPVGRRLLGMSDGMFGVLNLIGRCPERAVSGAGRLCGFHDLRQFVAATCEYRTRRGQTAIVRFAVHCLGGAFGCAAPRTGAVRFRIDLGETRKDRLQ